MNEEIEYAEMLEIPVSTVNVVKKKRRARAKARPDLKEQLISQVNEAVSSPATDHVAPSVVGEGDINRSNINGEEGNNPSKDINFEASLNEAFGEEGAFTVEARDYNQKKRNKRAKRTEADYPVNSKVASHGSRGSTIALTCEFAAACMLCAGIFLTNVFMPQSAINTFFRGLTATKAETDVRAYTDFKLTPIIGANSNTELTLSPAGVLSFTDKGCVYPSVDGTVSAITKNEDGSYQVRIDHTDNFYGVLNGLDYVYYEVGEKVYANVPIGYSKGETEVQATMYSAGELLDCFTLNENNCLVWAETK